MVVDATTHVGQEHLRALLGLSTARSETHRNAHSDQETLKLPPFSSTSQGLSWIHAAWGNATQVARDEPLELSQHEHMRQDSIERVVAEALPKEWPGLFRPRTADRLLESGVCGCRPGFVAV